MLIGLASSEKLHYAGLVASGGSPPHPLKLFLLQLKSLCGFQLEPARIHNKEGWFMTSQKAWAKLAVAVMLSLPLTACKDTKTLQENDQLKTQVAELQKENGQLGNNLETVTAARDSLARENEELKAAMKPRKTERTRAKSSSRKHRRNKKALAVS
jgi:FtsZ-binding cell division protein ZapB